jgi:hypothetical protein
MNIKSIAGDAQRPASNREERKKKAPAAETPTEPKEPSAQTPEAGDASLLASQPVDSQTLAELLSHPAAPPHSAKFLTPAPSPTPIQTAKKLNQKA